MPNFWLLQVRQNIRDKYGIEKKQPTSKSDKQKAAMMEELKKEYGLDDEDAKELEDKMKKVWSLKQNLISLPPYNFFFQDAAERDAAKEKVEQKMEVTLRHYKSMIINHPSYSRCGRWRKSWRRTLEWTNASSNDIWGTLVQLWPVPSDPTWFALTSNLKKYVWIGSGSSLKFKDDSIKHTALP